MAKIFLKFDPPIEGGSQAAGFEKQIVVESFSWGETFDKNAVNQDFHFAAITDRQSPKLLQACAEGTHFNSAELNMVNELGQAFYTLKLGDVNISSYAVGASEAAGKPNDQATLRFRTIQNEFRAQKPDGSLDAPVVGGFDFGK